MNMSKKIIISESEKSEIRRLHNLSEQTVGDALGLLADLVKKYKNSSSNNSSSTETTDSSSTGGDYLNNTSDGTVDSKWMKVTKKVIDKFEGGYWNPVCGHATRGMGKSTETMFGLDRFNGNIESTSDGKEFFRIIDDQKKKLGKDGFCKKWKHGFTGGELENELKSLAAKIMKHSYDRNVKNYFSSELKKRVEKNDRLLMHFSYASWNGPVFFKKFAESLNKAVEDGLSDKELIQKAISDRKNTGLYNQDKVAALLTDPNLNLS